MRLQKERRRCAAMWALPVMLCTGCAAPPTVSAVSCPAIPLPPPLVQPIPAQSYSQRAQADMQSWLQRLTDMPRMP